MRHRISRVLAIGLALCAAAAAGAADLPRYKLQTGQVLTYSQQIELGGKQTFKGRQTFIVCGKAGDGWRIFMLATPDGGQIPRPAMTLFTLQPDGQVEGASFDADPRQIFLRLPQNDAQLGATWDSPAGIEGFFRISATASSEKELRFNYKRISTVDEIYEVTSTCQATFDLTRGLVSRITHESTQNYPSTSKSTGTMVLENVEQKDGQFAADIDRQATAAIAAQKAYSKAMEDFRISGEKAPLDQALAAMKATAGSTSYAPLGDFLANGVRQHDSNAQYLATGAQKTAAILNHPVKEFSLEKIGGGKVSTKDLQGKVVLLDFWYRGCGWCMYAMPQLNQLAQDYKDKPVQVFGMNIDEKESDATFVIDKLKLTYPTLKLKSELATEIGAQGYPTLIVIDKQGTVRHVHIGYTPTLREDLAKVIDNLLAK